MILLYALLELAKQYAEPCIDLLADSTTPSAGFLTSGIISRPKGIREARHVECMSGRLGDEGYRSRVVDDVDGARRPAM
jgi:hypothetical protein